MTTLSSAPLAPLLERLFAMADGERFSALPELSDKERERMLTSKTEYLKLYGLARDLFLPVSRQTGQLLYMLARASEARTIVEFGMSFGISTLYLAAALRDNGGGRVITSEFEPDKVRRARGYFEEAGLTGLIEVREGDVLQTFLEPMPAPVDLVFLDGAKALYPDVLNLLRPHMREGTLVIADDADMCPAYLDYVRGKDNDFLSLPFAGDIEVSMFAV